MQCGMGGDAGGQGDFDFAADFGFHIFQHGKRIVRTGQQAGAGSGQRAPRLGGAILRVLRLSSFTPY